eukprot:13977332-Alexandrium_andersonii.AAC.1
MCIRDRAEWGGRAETQEAAGLPGVPESAGNCRELQGLAGNCREQLRPPHNFALLRTAAYCR